MLPDDPSPPLPATVRGGRWLTWTLGALLVAALALGLLSGSVPVSVGDLLHLATGAAVDPIVRTAVLDLRLPRLLAGLLVGAALAQSGAVMQALFRNPLAEPGLVGVSAGAAAAAAAVFVFGAAMPQTAFALLLPTAAFAGGIAVTALVLRLARVDGETRMSTLLLAGAAINAFVAALVGLLAAVAGDGALRGFTLWLYGDLGRAGWTDLAIAAPVLLGVIVALPRDSRALDALLLGDAEAAHLGIEVETLRRRSLLLAVLAAAVAVALAGLIGFVGLLVPHAIRLIAGPGHRRLLPGAAVLGAATLVIADALARRLAAPAELPIGVLTALLGAPFFLILLLRLRGRPESL